MTQPPPIYVRSGGFAVTTPWQRLIAASVAVACLVVLIVATRLEPSPTGLGTHTGLGMDRCGYLARSGIPCPTCGMTTSFAHFVRGQVLSSIYAQPMGALLALGAGMAVWAGGYIAISGRPAYRLLRLIPTRLYVIPLLTLSVTAWAWKIYIVVQASH